MPEVTVNKDLENKTLTIECMLDAPKAKLWRAFADKEWFEKWWGPEGWETTTKEFNFTPGGRIHYRMKCIDQNQGEWFGQESWGFIEIEGIDEPNSFSGRDNFSNPEGTVQEGMPSQRLEVELVEEGGKTRMINRSLLDTAEQLEELVKMSMAEGFKSQLNRLEALLKED